MLFCPSFTQSERFLHTDQLITRLQVVVMTNFIRMLSGNVIVHVFKSDATCRVRRLAPFFFHESQSCRTVRPQHNRPKRAIAHVAPLVSRCDSLTSSTNQCHQLGFTRTQTNDVLLLGGRMHGIPRVFNRTLDPNCNSRAAATIFDVSSPNQHRSSLRPNLAECPQFQEHQDCNQRSCCMQDFQSSISANA